MNEFKHFGETIRIRGGNIDSIECSNDIPDIIVNVTPETPVIGYTGSCTFFQNGHKYDFGEVKLTPKYITFDWDYEKLKSKFKIKKIQINPKKNATAVIFENGHVEVVKKEPGEAMADIYSVVAYAVTKYVYGTNSAFKRQIKNCIVEILEEK